MHRSPSGFTLIELALTLAIAALLTAAATPSFQRLRGDWQVATAAQSLLVALHHARSVAATRNQPVALCQTDAAGACLSAAGAGSVGWQVFVDRTVTTPPHRDATDELLSDFALHPQVTLSGTRAAVTYWAGARAGTTATFTLCDSQHHAPPRAIIVSQTGRPRASRLAADGGPLICP